jgi:hypothetical protein
MESNNPYTIYSKTQNNEIVSFMEILKLTNQNDFLYHNFLWLNAMIEYSEKEVFDIGEVNYWSLDDHQEIEKARDFLWTGGGLYSILTKCYNLKYHDIFFSHLERNTRILEVIFFQLDNELINLQKCRNEISDKPSIKLQQNNPLKNYYEDRLDLLNNSIHAIKEFMNAFHLFVPHFMFRNSLIILPEESASKNRSIDKRISKYAPTNNERLKALSIFCPELIKRLHNLTRKDKEIVLLLITGVNKDDAYKTLFNNKKVLDNTVIKNDEIDIQELKTKLNIT